MTKNIRGLAGRLTVAGVLVLGALVGMVSAQTPGDEPGSRQIVPEIFTRARNPGTSASSPAGRHPTAAKKPRNYRRVARTNLAANTKTAEPKRVASASTKWEDIPESAEKVGVTIWHLRSAQSGEPGARLLVQRVDMVPERVAADALLSVGDHVVLSIESPRAGYLYIVDRELYAGGKMGEPYLIFPTTHTRGGDNQVLPGKLINIPDRDDQPNNFTLVPNPARQDQVGELLSVIVTTKPLGDLASVRRASLSNPADGPTLLSSEQIVAWEGLWGGRNEQFDLDGGAGQPMTEAESAASKTGEGKRLLVQEEPPPQEFYLVDSKSKEGLLVNVQLLYRK